MQTAHVIGAGGIGMALGFFLTRGGWNVTMVESNPAKLAAGQRDGIAVNGAEQRNVRFTAFEDWTPPNDTLLLLCTKTFDNPAVLARVTNREFLIPVQNGFDPALDASGHPFEGTASFVSQCERERPRTRITRRGELHLGGRQPLTAAQRQVLDALAGGLRRGGCQGVRVVSLIGPYKSAKLMYNAAIAPLAAAAGMDNEGLLSDPLARRLFFALLRENYAILKRSGAPLARIGPFHPSVVDRILGVPGVARAMALFFRPSLRGTYCSMAADMGTARTEIAAYNGHLVQLAQGRACPINQAVLEMMSAMQVNGLSPKREMLVTLGSALGMKGLL